MLKDYVKAVADRIISDKQTRGIYPACCTLAELIHEATDDMTECLRELHKQGDYRAFLSGVNRMPAIECRQKSNPSHPDE